MDDQTQQQTQPESDQPEKEAKKVITKVTCPHCGKEIEAEVEIPESSETPKVTWIT